MNRPRDAEQAFISSLNSAFLQRTSIIPIISSHPVRRRNRSFRNWRCMVQIDPASDEPGKSGTDPQVRLEGPLPLDVLDADLEAALSKGWDQLEDFSGTHVKTSARARRNDLHSLEDALDGSEAPDLDQASDTVGKEGMKGADVHSAQKSNLKTTVKKKKGAAKKGKVTKRKGKGTKVIDEGEKISLKELDDMEEWINEPRWYFVQVKPGCEQSTAISIRNMSESLERSKVQEVLVPTTKIMRLTKGGKSVKKEERFFPGYILVLMVMNRENYSDVQGIPNVQWFMGDPNRDKKKDQPFRPPLPVSDAEMKAVFEKIKDAESAKPEIKTAIRPGDTIAVRAGSFEGNSGKVLEVKPDLNIIKASLLMFGRETSVELALDHVEVVHDIMNIREPKDDGVEETENSSSQEKIKKKSEDGNSDGITSTSDDLEAILNGDDDFDPSSILTFGKSGAEKELDDGFDEAETIAEDTSQQGGSKRGLVSSGDELAMLLSDDDDSDLWAPEDFGDEVNGKTTGNDSNSSKYVIQEESGVEDPEYEVDEGFPVYDHVSDEMLFDNDDLIPTVGKGQTEAQRLVTEKRKQKEKEKAEMERSLLDDMGIELTESDNPLRIGGREMWEDANEMVRLAEEEGIYSVREPEHDLTKPIVEIEGNMKPLDLLNDPGPLTVGDPGYEEDEPQSDRR